MKKKRPKIKIKKRVAKKPSAKAVDDFEVYARGVHRLDELRKQVDDLDTRRFKREEKAIRKKLKSVHLIPEIEYDLRELRAKVAGIDVKRESEIDKGQNKRISELNKKLTYLKEELKKVEKKTFGKKKSEKTKLPIDSLHKQMVLKQAIKELEERTERISEQTSERTAKIPVLQKRVNVLSKLLGKKDRRFEKDFAHEQEKIKELRTRLFDLKKELEKKTEELEKELQKKTKAPARKKIIGQIHHLSEKIDANKEELSNRLTEGISESKWAIEKEKQEMRDELADLVAESKWLIEKEGQEINEQLVQKIEELKEKAEKDKKELYDKLLDRIVQLKAQVNAIEHQHEQKQEIEDEGSDAFKTSDIASKPETKVTESFDEMPQPFIAPQKFDEVKVTGIEPEPSKLPELSGPLDESEFSSSFELPEITKKSMRADSALFDIPEMYDISELPKAERESEKGKLLTLPEISEPAPPHLQEIAPDQFEKDLKAAIKHSQQELKKEKPKKPKKLKSKIFLELDRFKEVGQNIDNVQHRIRSFEQGVASSTASSKEKESSEISSLITQTKEINVFLTKINKKILSKIKEV